MAEARPAARERSAEKAAAKPTTRRRARSPGSDAIRIRMYRVGFGDCFLITLPGDRHILVDCGVHPLGDIGTLEAVIADLAAVTRRRLALVVATHAHVDHVSGFLRGEKAFRSFDIGEIWLPWTEDPTKSAAHQLQRERRMVARALHGGAAAADVGSADVAPAAAAVVANAAAAEAEAALDLLRGAFGNDARVRFLGAGESFQDTCGVSGLTARVVGPPSGERALKTLHPPRAQRLPRASADGSPVWEGALMPFGREWIAAEGTGPRLTDRERRRLVRSVESSPARLAFALDRAVNDTSLMCLFSFRGRTLLFPGDAQQRSWNSWLTEEEASAVLGTVSFYKVSHHGSEGGTPPTAIEWMTRNGLVAMVSTQASPWPTFPHAGVLAALTERTGGRLARSDVIPVPGAEVSGPSDGLASVFEVGPLWIDCRLSV